jgi:hypothetical protein
VYTGGQQNGGFDDATTARGPTFPGFKKESDHPIEANQTRSVGWAPERTSKPPPPIERLQSARGDATLVDQGRTRSGIGGREGTFDRVRRQSGNILLR